MLLKKIFAPVNKFDFIYINWLREPYIINDLLDVGHVIYWYKQMYMLSMLFLLAVHGKWTHKHDSGTVLLVAHIAFVYYIHRRVIRCLGSVRCRAIFRYSLECSRLPAGRITINPSPENASIMMGGNVRISRGSLKRSMLTVPGHNHVHLSLLKNAHNSYRYVTLRILFLVTA